MVNQSGSASTRINGVVVTWVVAIKSSTSSTRRGFDSLLMHSVDEVEFFLIESCFGISS